MKRIFVDTNILLDVLLDREPHCHPAQIIWTLAEGKKIRGAVSALSTSHIFFVVNKLAGRDKAYRAVNAVVETFHVIDTRAAIIRRALQARFDDFEDALQYFSALQFRAQAIVTRDAAGFENGHLPVVDAVQFLSLK